MGKLYLIDGNSIEDRVRNLEAQCELAGARERKTIVIQLEILEQITNSAIKVNFDPITELSNLKNQNGNGTH